MPLSAPDGGVNIYGTTSSFGIISRQEALREGTTRREFEKAVAAGLLTRVDRSRYALLETPSEVVTAACAGAVVTCTSALRLHGVDTWNDHKLHLRLPRYAQRHRGLPESAVICDHTEPISPTLVDPLDRALTCVARSHPTEDLLVILDSLLHKRFRTLAELHFQLQGVSERARRTLSLATGLAESPPESVLRYRLAMRRIRSSPQVVIPGVGRVDLLVGKSLILEMDGRTWHESDLSFETDRCRDREATARGYTVIRVTPRQLTTDWPAVLHSIQAVVRARRHLKPPLS